MPNVFTNCYRNPLALKFKKEFARARHEVAPVVKYVVVRQVLLVVATDNRTT